MSEDGISVSAMFLQKFVLHNRKYLLNLFIAGAAFKISCQDFFILYKNLLYCVNNGRTVIMNNLSGGVHVAKLFTPL
jgi:hypothetical protein